MESSEANKPTSKERLNAVWETLKQNKSVQIDAALAGAADLSFLINPAVGMVAAEVGPFIRPMAAELVNNARRQEAIRSDYSSYGTLDSEYSLKYLVEAWKTGKVQLPVRAEGNIDGMDRIQTPSPKSE